MEVVFMKSCKSCLVLLLILLLLMPLAACSATSTKSQNDYSPTTAATTTAGWNEGQAPDADTGAGNVQNIDRKIVRNAALSLEVMDVEKAYAQLLAYAAERKGYEARRNQSVSGGFTYLTATIKLVPGELDGFIAYAGTIGTLVNTQISTEDITEGYYDSQTRLASMEKTLARYYEFLTQARNIEETLAVQTQINQLTVEIESLKGKLKLWDSWLAESVITLELRQINDPVKIKKEITWSSLSFEDMGYLMRSGLTTIANVLVTVVQWLAIALVAAAPIWIIALVLFLIWRRRRQRRKAAAKAVQAKKTEAPAADFAIDASKKADETAPSKSEQSQTSQDKGADK
jgi:hypothetical protein